MSTVGDGCDVVGGEVGGVVWWVLFPSGAPVAVEAAVFCYCSGSSGPVCFAVDLGGGSGSAVPVVVALVFAAAGFVLEVGAAWLVTGFQAFPRHRRPQVGVAGVRVGRVGR